MNWWRRRVVAPITALLRKGIEPRSLALALALGCGVGVFPVLGVSTLALTGLALWLRLNLPAIQLVNYLVAPFQLLLIIPFLRAGESLLGRPHLPMTIDQGLAIMRKGLWQAVEVLSGAIVHAALAWCVIMPVVIWLLYRIFALWLNKISR